jgi:hypothetical protein
MHRHSEACSNELVRRLRACHVLSGASLRQRTALFLSFFLDPTQVAHVLFFPLSVAWGIHADVVPTLCSAMFLSRVQCIEPSPARRALAKAHQISISEHLSDAVAPVAIDVRNDVKNLIVGFKDIVEMIDFLVLDIVASILFEKSDEFLDGRVSGPVLLEPVRQEQLTSGSFPSVNVAKLR